MVGLIALNKASGLSSHEAVAQLRRKVGGLKAGHAGTLDPQATGVLLVLLDQATKLAPLFAGLPKKYRATFRLGITTDTDDVWGKVLSQSEVPDLSTGEIEKILSGFVGTIKQKVPAFSAVKSKGKPLYKKARKGEVFEAPEKEVTFHFIRLLGWKRPELEVEVVCSSGTYIRALARDFGQKAGTGAAMAALVRTAVGPVTLADTVPIEAIRPDDWKKHLLDPRSVLGLPALRLVSEPAKVRDGRPLLFSDLKDLDDYPKGQTVLVENGGEVLAWGHLSESADFLKKNPERPAFVYGRVLA